MKSTYLSIALIAASGAAGAGVTFKSVDGSGKPSVVFIDGNRLRIEGEETVMIFDGDKKELISVDQRKRTYSVANESDMRRAGATIRDQIAKGKAEMRKRMADMPPEQRKQMEAVLLQMDQGGPMGAAVHDAARERIKYQSAGESKQIAGRSCAVYRMIRSDGSEEKACFVRWGDAGVSKDDLKVFESLSSFMATMMEGMGAKRGSVEDWTRQMRDAPGVPIQMVDSSGNVDMELKSIDRGSVSADKFRAPAGYAKSEKAMFGGE